MPVWNRGGVAAPIVTPRLRLWPLGPEHAAALFPLLRKPRIYDWISMRRPESVSALARRWGELRQESAGEREEYFFGWAAQSASDGAWLGALDADVRADGVASNVGYWFAPEHWGQGYASEALAALSRHLAVNGVHEQRATVTLGNDASMRVLERGGFVRGRVLRDNDSVGGRLVDDVEFVRYGASSDGWRVLRARRDEAALVADILSEAAAWLKTTGREMWLPEEVAIERVAADAAAGWFHFIERAGVKLGVVKIQYDDPVFWPDAAAGESVFLHRLAVRRRFAGQGALAAVVQHARDLAMAQGLRYVRLDCDADRPALRAHYLRHGFVHSDDAQAGPWKVSRLEMETGRAHDEMDTARIGATCD